ncbi:MAG TPA: cation:proton antiporter [Solirubrobacterales bacterium]|nr:cation:proton antiporter [Solirubrobacterales bacterium]
MTALALPGAADPGFSFADPLAIGLLVCGLAVFAAIGALSHEGERAFSASMIYLALGAGASVVIQLVNVSWVDPLEDYELVERLTELAVIIALFGTGMQLDRPLQWGSWARVARLLVIAMPLTIAAITLFGTQVMGLSLGAAIVLGAILAPTDPVLAGDIGVGPPGDEEEREPNFSVTGEAGLNDGFAFPFLLLGLFVATEGGTDWLGEWALADVAYAIAAGIAIGAAAGYGLGGLAVELRKRRLLDKDFDAWLAIPSVLAIYGLTEVAGGYGFIAAFAGGLAFRRYEHTHEYNRTVHEGAEVVEKIGELAVILLLGSMLTFAGLGQPGLEGWLLVPALLLVIRPATVFASLLRSRLPVSDRAFIAWFGVRGVGSLYYVAVALGSGALAAEEAKVVVWTTIACVLVSILVHGVTAEPLSRRWLPAEQQPRRRR